MKKGLLIGIPAFFLLCMFCLTGCGNTAENPWLTKWDSAVEGAETSGKNILVFFSMLEGGNSQEILMSQSINNAFNNKSFKKGLAKKYVLLNINFNPNEMQEDYEQMMSYYELANRFSVQALPSLLLVTPDGYVIHSESGVEMEKQVYEASIKAQDKKGSSPESVTKAENRKRNEISSKVLARLSKYNKKSKAVTKLRIQLLDEKGIERAVTADKLISNLDKDYSYQLKDLISEIKANDPDNEKGLWEKYTMHFAYAEALEEFKRGNAQGAIDIFIQTAQSKDISPDEAQEANLAVAYFLMNTGIGSPESAVEYLEKAILACPDSDKVSSIQDMIDYIKMTNPPKAE